jgi:TRAP-type C4-dicarboxylate transport system permease small subunit
LIELGFQGIAYAVIRQIFIQQNVLQSAAPYKCRNFCRIMLYKIIRITIGFFADRVTGKTWRDADAASLQG